MGGVDSKLKTFNAQVETATQLLASNAEESQIVIFLEGFVHSLKNIIPHHGYGNKYDNPSGYPIIKAQPHYSQYGFRFRFILDLFEKKYFEAIKVTFRKMLINSDEILKCLKSDAFQEKLIECCEWIPATLTSNYYCSPLDDHILNWLNYNHVIEKLLASCIQHDNIDKFIKVYLHYGKITGGINHPTGASFQYMAHQILKLSGKKVKLQKYMIQMLEATKLSIYQELSPMCAYGDACIWTMTSEYSYLWNWYLNHPDRIIQEKDQTHINMVEGVLLFNTYKEHKVIEFINKASEIGNQYVKEQLQQMIFGTHRLNLFVTDRYLQVFEYLFAQYWPQYPLNSKFVWLSQITQKGILTQMCNSDLTYNVCFLSICKYIRQLLQSGQITDTHQYLILLQYCARNTHTTKLKILHDTHLFSHDTWLTVYRDNPNVRICIEDLMELDSELFRKNKASRLKSQNIDPPAYS
jgi:hypothetical protein